MYSNEYDEEEQEQSNGSFLANFYNNNKVLVWIFAGIIIFILLMSLLTGGGRNNKGSNTNYDVTIIPDGDVFVLLGKSTNLVASVKNDPKAEITWSVEDETIVKVDNGNVTGLDYGKTKVMATYIDGKNEKHTAYKEVTVAKGDSNVTLTDVSFKDGDLFMPLNSTYTIALTLTPSTGYVESEKFTSSDTSVVTVDNKGLVTAVGEGSATIVFDVNNGQFRKELNVYVDREYNRTEIIVTPSRIMLDGELRKIKVGTVDKLSYTVEPSNADSGKLIWSSSDENIVTVENGRIKGISEGMAVVTVSALNGTQDRIDVEVESDIVQVTDINLSVSDIYLTVGQSQSIIPIISPANASNKALSYTSIDSSVAVVSPNGTGTQATITGINQGNTTIVIKSSNNIEKRVHVIVSSGSQGGSSGGSGSGGGGSTTNQGFKITSKDANWEKTHEGFIVQSHEKTDGNAATAPVEINVQKTSSSVSKLVVLVCTYPASSSCGSLYRYETTDSVTFTLRNNGDYVIRVEEYNSSNTLTRTTDKYILVGGGSSGESSATYTVSPTLYDGTGDANNHAYSKGTKLTFKANSSVGYIKVCWAVGGGSCSLTAASAKTVTGTTTFNDFQTEGLYAIRIAEYYNGSSTAYSTKTKYIKISSGGQSPSPSPTGSGKCTKDSDCKSGEVCNSYSETCVKKSTSTCCCRTSSGKDCEWSTSGTCSGTYGVNKSGLMPAECKKATGTKDPGVSITKKSTADWKISGDNTFAYNVKATNVAGKFYNEIVSTSCIKFTNNSTTWNWTASKNAVGGFDVKRVSNNSCKGKVRIIFEPSDSSYKIYDTTKEITVNAK